MKRLVLAALLLASCAAVKPTPPPPAGDPEPPAWVSEFAKSFCAMDATTLAKYLSPIALDLPPEWGDEFTPEDLRPRLPTEWPCKTVDRYLGFGQFGDGGMEYYFRFDFGDHTPAYGFIVDHNKVIRVD